MTIAFGARCVGGVAIAADSRIVATSGATHDASKVHSCQTGFGRFVLAYSTDDANAAASLADTILRETEQADPRTLADFEVVVESVMTRWRAGFAQAPVVPIVQMVAGVYIKTQSTPPPDRSGGGSALYFCEPPNTVRYSSIHDSSRGYVSVGIGATVADPIFKALFSVVPEPRVRLCQFAYLMYRAKKDCAAYCGGPTNAVFIRDDGSDPVFITPVCMERAERLCSCIDSIFESVVSEIFSSGPVASENLRRVAEQFQALGFYSVYGEEI